MILDWLDRILARILPVRTRNGGRHSHVKGDPFDRDNEEFLPYMRPGSYSSAPDSPLAFRSFGDPNLGAAAVSVPLEMHHPRFVCCDDVPAGVPHSHAHNAECDDAYCHGCASVPYEMHHPADLPGPEPIAEPHGVTTSRLHRAGEPPSNEDMGNWHKLAATVLPDWVIEALGGHDTVDAAVDSICRRAESAHA